MGFDYGTSHRTIINKLLETEISLKLGERCVGKAPGQLEERGGYDQDTLCTHMKFLNKY